MEIKIANSFTKEEYWQNFNLGTELDIAGTFIYNGIDAFDKIRDFRYTADLFEVLYNLSVGIERLMKIVVILTEFHKESDSDGFEKTLITHNHMELCMRIKQKHKIILASPHNKFIQLLTEFYKTMRYDRYGINSVYFTDKEKYKFFDFIVSSLNDSSIQEDLKNNNRIKRFLGRVVHKIVTQLFEIINQEAGKKNIYTTELKYDSKAARVFWGKELDFYKDNIYKREILLHLIAHLPNEEISKCKPLNLTSCNIETYINALFNHRNFSDVCDEIETIYEDDLKGEYNTSIKERLEEMEYFELFFDTDIYEIENES